MNIESNYKTINYDSKVKLKTIFKWLFPDDKADSLEMKSMLWIAPNKQKIKLLITEHFSNVNSIKGYLNAITHVVKNPAFKNDTIHKEFSKLALSYLAISELNEEHQQLSGNELHNWKSYHDILAVRADLERIKDRDWWAHRRWFVVCLYTLQPPLHADFHDMRILQSRHAITTTRDLQHFDIDPQKNYWLIANDQHWILIQKDKTSHFKGASLIRVEPALETVMIQSMIDYPRDYVLGRKSLSIYGFRDLLKNIGIGIDTFRSAFITYFYKDLSIADRKKIAEKMRHSYTTAEKKYFKVSV